MTPKRVLVVQRALLAIAGVWLLVFCVAAAGQAPTRGDVEQLGRRIDKIDDGAQALRVELEKRLTRLETLIETTQTILYGVAGALALQLVETFWGLVAARRKTERADAT